MPNLQNIASVVAGARSRHLLVEAGRCVEVRHRRAHCGACMDVCPEDAITVKDNRITVVAELCAGCGSCASVCPTQALRTVGPSTDELLAFVDELARESRGSDIADGKDTVGSASGESIREPVLEFACEHAADAGADARIVVPALPYVDESVLVHAAATGFTNIALTCCARPECLKPTLAAMPEVLATARTLLEAAGSSCRIRLRKQKAGTGDARGAGTANGARGATAHGTGAASGASGYSRRGMLSDVAAQAKTIVAETAAAELRDKLGQQQEQPTLMQTLTDGQGNLLKFPMPRAETLLDSLYVLNPEPTGTLSVRGFAQVKVNATACTRCGMCVRFCPTGALQGEAAPISSMSFLDPWHGTRDDEATPQGSLAFRTCDCVACRLCETACPLHCLHVNSEVDASTIFNLEPMDLLA